MSPQNLPFVPAEQRFTLVYGPTPVAGQGPSLQELDSASLPDGAVVYCVYKNAFYRLYKSSTVTPDTTSTYNNVVAASGGGNWVRTTQLVQGLLVGGEATFTGLDLPDAAGLRLVVSLISPHGTPGFLYAIWNSRTAVHLFSTSSSDTSLVLLEATQGNLTI